MSNDVCIGRELPSAKLENTAGGTVNFPNDARGKWTLLYFYPKDDTPGCTKQACSYRDGIGEFNRLGVKLFGVSGDDIQSHNAFIGKFQLNFPLLSDTQHALSSPLGVYGEQTWKGQTYKGLSRDTFLIGPDAKIREVWRKVNPETTLQETLEAVKKYL